MRAKVSAMNASVRRIGPLLSFLLALVILMPAATQPAAAAPPNKLGIRPVWGACGAFSEEAKLVFDYGFLKLRCGSVKTRADGYNHVKANHKTQFAMLAAPAGRRGKTWFILHWHGTNTTQTSSESTRRKTRLAGAEFSAC